MHRAAHICNMRHFIVITSTAMANVSGYFSKVFGESPFGDLQEHAKLCLAATEELKTLFPATFDGQWGEVENCYNRLSELEQQADQVKRKIRTNLPRGLFLPVARADLLDLLGRQDELANTARDIAGRILGRELQFPAQLRDDVIKLVDTTVATCSTAQQIVDRLDELINTAFKGPQARIVVDLIEEVEDLEHETDQMVVRIRRVFQAVEEQYPPVQVVFLYRILDLISELADDAEKVAHRVQLMLAK